MPDISLHWYAWKTEVWLKKTRKLLQWCHGPTLNDGQLVCHPSYTLINQPNFNFLQPFIGKSVITSTSWHFRADPLCLVVVHSPANNVLFKYSSSISANIRVRAEFAQFIELNLKSLVISPYTAYCNVWLYCLHKFNLYTAVLFIFHRCGSEL